MKAAQIKKTAEDVIKELTQKLGGPTSSAAFIASYVGAQNHPKRKKDEQSQLVFWGHSAGGTRRALERLSLETFIKEPLSPQDEWKIWHQVWKLSDIFEIKSIALGWMGSKKRKNQRQKNIKDLIKMAIDIDNWALSDGLSSLLAELLEENQKMLSLYKKWNRSKNPWLRRQSIVGIYCYARSRQKPLAASIALEMIEPLLEDPHFYVQRGVGWTLREVDRVDSKLQRRFVKKNLHRIGPTAWFATSELYPVKLRKELVELRKEKRKRTPSRVRSDKN